MMAGMLRFKDEKEFKAMLDKSNATVHAPRIVRQLGIADPHPSTPRRGEQAQKATKEKVVSEIEELLASQIRLVKNLPEPKREYPFLRGRAHRLDFAWPDHRVNGMQIGVEVQGMVHRVKNRFSADLEKRALGLLQGWLILEVGGDQIRSGKAMEWIQELFTMATKA